jgi:hypothetical protein
VAVAAVAAVVVLQLHVLCPVSYVYQLAFQALQAVLAVTAVHPANNSEAANRSFF